MPENLASGRKSYQQLVSKCFVLFSTDRLVPVGVTTKKKTVTDQTDTLPDLQPSICNNSSSSNISTSGSKNIISTAARTAATRTWTNNRCRDIWRTSQNSWFLPPLTHHLGHSEHCQKSHCVNTTGSQDNFQITNIQKGIQVKKYPQLMQMIQPFTATHRHWWLANPSEHNVLHNCLRLPTYIISF